MSGFFVKLIPVQANTQESDKYIHSSMLWLHVIQIF